MSVVNCSACGYRVAGQSGICDQCSPSIGRLAGPESALTNVPHGCLYSLGRFTRVNWVPVVIVVTSSAGILCLFAPTLVGVLLLTAAGLITGISLLTWIGAFASVDGFAKQTCVETGRTVPAGPPGASGWQQPTSTVTLMIAVMLGAYVMRSNQRQANTFFPGPNKATANQRAFVARANQQYWENAVLQAFVQRPLTIEAGDTVESLLEHDLANQRASLSRTRGQPTTSVDPDLISAVSNWITAHDRLIQWCEQNKAMLLETAKGLTAEQLAAQEESDFLGLVGLLPAEGLSPEIAEFRSIGMDLHAAIAELERMQIRLSERHRDGHFSPIGD